MPSLFQVQHDFLIKWSLYRKPHSSHAMHSYGHFSVGRVLWEFPLLSGEISLAVRLSQQFELSSAIDVWLSRLVLTVHVGAGR